LRLVRLHAPVSLGGTLADPAIGIKPKKLIVQTGAALALSSVLAPVAAALAFVDPGLAKDKNCTAILAQQNEVTAANGRTDR
jgi:AsmA family protein